LPLGFFMEKRVDDCVFCRIARHEADALILYEDENVISFLPIRPEVYGHTLICPKAHYADIYDIPSSVLAEVVDACKYHAQHFRKKINATGVNLLHASGADGDQSVFHFHIHLFPRIKDDGLNTWPMLPGTLVERRQMYSDMRFI
jgi:histidine triad (HIT) family protein